MARWPRARWHPVSTCGGTFYGVRGVTLHHQVGLGDPAGVYEARSVSAHFWIPYAGDPVQHVDTGVRAWHGGTDALNGNYLGVETEGCASAPNADPLNEHQLNLFAELMTWCHQVHGVPLVLSESASAPGLNYHRCQGGFNTACPCDVRKNARAEILRRASGGAPAPSGDEEEGNMISALPDGRSYYTATRDGAVYAFGPGAAYRGNAMKDLPKGRKIVGIAADEKGYRLLSDGGDLYCFGSDFYGKPDRV